MSLTGSAAIILLIAVVATALSALTFAALNAKRIKKLEPVIRETHDAAMAIDEAVSNKPSGNQTMRENVQDLHDDRPGGSPNVSDTEEPT